LMASAARKKTFLLIEYGIVAPEAWGKRAPTSGVSPGVSLFLFVQGRRDTEARRAFAWRACTVLPQWLKPGLFGTETQA
jgi:hypothetical protein